MRQIKTTTTTTRTRTRTTTARWATTAALGIAGLASPGCQRYVYAPRGGVQHEPVAIDQAMQIRDWEPSSARYTNPRFIAGPVGYWFQPAYDMPEPVYAVQETPMFALQTLALPLTVWFPPLWKPIEYAGETLEPTWHAMPLVAGVIEHTPPPAEVTEPSIDEPMTAPAAPAVEPLEPSNQTPGRTVAPPAEPMQEVPVERVQPAPAGQPTTPAQPAPAPAPRSVSTPAPSVQPTTRASTGLPATQPAYTPSTVTPSRTTPAAPATRPTTAPARGVNK